MKYILLDTNIYEEKGFNFNEGLLSALRKISTYDVTFLIHPVIKNEIRGHIKERCHEFYTTLKNARKEITGLSSLSRYKTFFEVKEEDILEDCLNEFAKFIDELKFQEINNDNVSIDEILESYFSINPPFGTGEKRKEFPDAIILNALIHTPFDDGDEILIVSKDNDWKKYYDINSSSQYKFFTSLYDLIMEIIPKEDCYSLLYNKTVENWLSKNEAKMKDLLDVELLNSFEFTIIMYYDEEITENRCQILDFEEVECINVDFKNNTCDIACTFQIDVDFDLEYKDYDNAYYDKEEQSYWFLPFKSQNYVGKVLGNAIISLNIKRIAGNKIYIDGINSVEFFQSEIEHHLEDFKITDLIEEDY